MRTALEDSPTKHKIMDAAQELMLTKGYKATSVEEICQSSEVAKGSFFHYFKNKEALGKELIQRYAQASGGKFVEIAQKHADALDRLYAYMDHIEQKIKSSEGRGCLVGTLTQEIHDSNPELRDCCGQTFGQAISMFEQDFKEAINRHAPSSKLEAREMAQFFMSIFQGSFILAKARQDKNIALQNLNQFRNYLKVLFKK